MRQLVVMVRAPVAGRVKTRLARDIGSVAAVQFYRHTASAVIARLVRGARGRWTTTLAVTPDGAQLPAAWLNGCRTQPQGKGDLGTRMQRILDRAPPGPVLIIGTDIPAIGAEDVALAFRALGPVAAVFGPAEDGGYWLVGLKRTPRIRSIFRCVRWSTEYALADTLANMAPRSASLTTNHFDVDNASDLRRGEGCHGRVVQRAVRPVWQNGYAAKPRS